MKPNRKKKPESRMTAIEESARSAGLTCTADYAPDIPRKADKVCIVGLGRSRTEAPFGDDSFEFWGFNDPIYDVPTMLFDRFFQLHATDYLATYYEPWKRDVANWQRQNYIPIYMQEAYPDIPQSIRFPKEDIEALTPRGRYHAATMDWLTAFAILEGFKEIHWYGLGKNGMNTGEPISARPCLEYWLGVAEGRGIKTYVHKGSDCFKIYQYLESERQYAWDESRPIVVVRPEDDEKARKQAKKAVDDALAELEAEDA